MLYNVLMLYNFKSSMFQIRKIERKKSENENKVIDLRQIKF